MSAASFLRRLLGRSRSGVGQSAQHLVSLCEALLGERGEVSGAALARQALTAYQGLDERGREEFFDILAQEFTPSPEAVGKAADAYRYEPTPQNLIQLQEVIDTARQESENCCHETCFHPEPTGYEKAVLSGVAAIRANNISGTV